MPYLLNYLRGRFSWSLKSVALLNCWTGGWSSGSCFQFVEWDYLYPGKGSWWRELQWLHWSHDMLYPQWNCHLVMNKSFNSVMRGCILNGDRLQIILLRQQNSLNCFQSEVQHKKCSKTFIKGYIKSASDLIQRWAWALWPSDCST